MKNKKTEYAVQFHNTVVKDQEFMALDEVKADSKNRISLGRKVRLKARFYKVFQNALGQIVLDPMETIPAHEAWLFKNKKAHESVMKGLDEARAGKLLDSPEDFSKYADKE